MLIVVLWVITPCNVEGGSSLTLVIIYKTAWFFSLEDHDSYIRGVQKFVHSSNIMECNGINLPSVGAAANWCLQNLNVILNFHCTLRFIML